MELKESDKQLQDMYASNLSSRIPALVEWAKSDSHEIAAVAAHVGFFGSADVLRKTVTDIRAQISEDKPAVIALAGCADAQSKPVIIVATNAAARDKGIKAGDLVRSASKILGGGGGGKPDLAQGGGADPSKIDTALEKLAAEVYAG